MRVQLWLTPILGMLLTVCGRQVSQAQFAPPPPGGQPMAAGMTPNVRHANAQQPKGERPARGTLLSGFKQPGPLPPNPGYVPGPGGPGAGPFAAGMQPHPKISPFDNRFEQTYNEDGLWKRLVNNDRRKYSFDLEWLHARLRRPVSTPIGTTFARREIETMGSPQSFTLKRGFVPLEQPVEGERVFPVDFKTAGMRGQWGYEDPDSSQVRIEGWWLTDSQVDFQPIGDVVPLVGTNNGPDILFDGGFRLTYQTEAFGSSAEYAFTPWKKGKYYAIRPVVALKYLNIQEEFGLSGVATGMFNTTLFNGTESHLVGPEAGISWELGGDFLKLLGESKFGVMYNREKIALSGNSWGLNDDGSTLPFAEKRYTSHASPTYEFSLVAEMKLFQYVPVLKKYQFFEDAVVRAGGTYIAAYEIARPNDTIDWFQAPRHPTIRHHRTKWHARWFNLGISWRY